jgi:hypothetical protein
MFLARMLASVQVRAAAALQSVLPVRSKRMVFLASLAQRLSNQSHFDKATRQKLNTVMQLAHGEDSLLLPMELSEVIWQGKKGAEIFRFDPAQVPITQENIKEMTQSVLQAMPQWLRYGEEPEIERDVATLFENRKSVFGF